MEFYPAANRKETTACAGKHLELKITVLNEISQAQEDKSVFSHSGIGLGFVSSIFLRHLSAQSRSQLSIMLVSLTQLSTWVLCTPFQSIYPAGCPPSFINLPYISS